MSISDQIKHIFQNRHYWSYTSRGGYTGAYISWMDNYPDIKSGKITPREYIMQSISKLTATEAIDLLPHILTISHTYSSTPSEYDDIVDKLIASYNITYDHDMFIKLTKQIAHLPVFVMLVLVEKCGYRPTLEQLTEYKDDPSRKRTNSNTDNNWLQKLMSACCTPYAYHGDMTLLQNVVKKVIENDKSVTKKYIVSPEFLSNFDLKNEKQRKVYGWFIDATFTEPVTVLTLLKILKRGVPYDCLAKFVKLCNFTDSEMCNIIEHVYVEEYIPGHEQLITGNLELIERNGQFDMTEIVTWMCRSPNKSISDTIIGLHKKMKFKFNQKHVDLLCDNPKENYTLIKYILESSNENEIVITRRIFDQVLSTAKVPRHVAMIAKYIKLE